MKVRNYYQKIKFEKERNKYNIAGDIVGKKQISLEYWNKKINLGDALALIIYKWILTQHNIKNINSKDEITHLMTVGSILSMGNFDSTVWGSGILSLSALNEIYIKSKYRKFDIRAVRGPITKTILTNAGYHVPDIFGDPGILMSLIYKPDILEQTIPYVVIPHYTEIDYYTSLGYRCLDIRTTDYKKFIDNLLKCKLIISSSLHGIILSETYGIPAILLHSDNNNIDLLKYYDYYFSTGRKSVKVASTVEEALDMTPMKLPELSKMQKDLLDSFPYDLFQI